MKKRGILLTNNPDTQVRNRIYLEHQVGTIVLICTSSHTDNESSIIQASYKIIHRKLQKLGDYTDQCVHAQMKVKMEIFIQSPKINTNFA